MATAFVQATARLHRKQRSRSAFASQRQALAFGLLKSAPAVSPGELMEIKRLDVEKAKKGKRLSVKEEVFIFKIYRRICSSMDGNGHSADAMLKTAKSLIERVIIDTNAGLLRSIARAVWRTRNVWHMSMEDLVQEGRIALLQKAIPRYDYRRGYVFYTFAQWWVRIAMDRAVQAQERTIRFPSDVEIDSDNVRNFQQSFYIRNGTMPTIQEIAFGLRIKPRAVERMLMLPTVSSMHESCRPGRKKARIDFIADSKLPLPDKAIANAQRQFFARTLVKMLDPKRRNVVKNRFGLGTNYGDELTLAQIGARWHITRQAVKQLEETALKKMRKAADRAHARDIF